MPHRQKVKATDFDSVIDGSNPSGAVQENYKMKTYELFTGKDLEVAELIQQRRYQLLIHSCIYYHLNQNVISDKKWDEWAKELRKLQEQYPYISEKVTLYEYFKDWDASTGAFLPITLDWVISIASRFVGTKKSKPKQEKKRRLF